MAEVADFHHLFVDGFEEEEVDDDIETLDSVPSWLQEYDHEPINSYDFYLDPDPDPDPDPDSNLLSPRSAESTISSDRPQNVLVEEEIQDRGVCVEIVGSDQGSDSDSVVSEFNYFTTRQDDLVDDLFERSERSGVVDNDDFMSNPFAVDEPFYEGGYGDENNNEIGSHYLELGLGLGFDRVHGGEEDDQDNGFMIEECGSDFFVRRSRTEPSGLQSFEIPTVGDCLRVIGIPSDSDEEEEEGVIDFRNDDGFDQGEEDDLGVPLCWDCLHLEDQREDFEWEEVDDDRVDLYQREVLSMVIDAVVDEEDISVSSTDIHSSEVVQGREEIMRNLEWEVLLAVNNLERTSESEHDVDHEDYIYPAEYELIFGQFTENENALRGSPPAAKSVLENLPTIVLTQDHVQNKSALCAVCKDEFASEETAKLLPCTHYYHGDCILPWLHIRNTCPVCRFELPTDDPEYERRRT